MPIEYKFCFICCESCIEKTFCHAKILSFCSVFKKIIPDATTPTLHEMGGVNQPIIFCQWHKIFSLYLVNLYKID